MFSQIARLARNARTPRRSWRKRGVVTPAWPQTAKQSRRGWRLDKPSRDLPNDAAIVFATRRRNRTGSGWFSRASSPRHSVSTTPSQPAS